MEDLTPIHKFNNGIGATLCNKCNAMICEGFVEDLYCKECGGDFQYKYKLVRERDGLTKLGNKAQWVEWSEEYGNGKDLHAGPAVGRSLILDWSIMTWKWLTTSVTEVVEQREDYVKFKTENSTYELFIQQPGQEARPDQD